MKYISLDSNSNFPKIDSMRSQLISKKIAKVYKYLVHSNLTSILTEFSYIYINNINLQKNRSASA